MKRTNNINRVAKVSLVACAVFALSATNNLYSVEGDSVSSLERLDSMNNRMEKAIKYSAPEMAEADFYLTGEDCVSDAELEVARLQLEGFNLSMEESLRYEAPSVAEDIDRYELEVARERLDDLHLTMEESLKYKPITENPDIDEYEVKVALERLESFTLAVEQSIKF